MRTFSPPITLKDENGIQLNEYYTTENISILHEESQSKEGSVTKFEDIKAAFNESITTETLHEGSQSLGIVLGKKENHTLYSDQTTCYVLSCTEVVYDIVGSSTIIPIQNKEDTTESVAVTTTNFHDGSESEFSMHD